MEVKILSWNIMHGGGSRIPAIIQSCAQINPTFIIFSEYRHTPKSKLLLDQLYQLGYTNQFHTKTYSQENTVLIAAKLPGESVPLTYSKDEEFTHTTLAVDFGAFTLVGAYFPHKKKHYLFEAIDRLLLERSNVILAGDLNTGINHLDQVGNSFWYEKEFAKLINSEMVDAFRHVHGESLEYSWYSHGGNGFRYDHTLVSADLEAFIKDCSYLHSYRTDRVSDHSPMLLTFGL